MSAKLLEHILSGSRLYSLYRSRKIRRKNARKLLQWENEGKPVPPPHVVKQFAVQEYAKLHRLRSFVETGTYRAQMVEAVKGLFDTIVSIELETSLYEQARKRFAKESHITLIHGDSGEVLKNVLAVLNEPTLFWLDGHYSGHDTAKGEMDTPIMKELDSIFSHRLAKEHVILIDDARCFDKQGDFPDIRVLERAARAAGFDRLEVKDDIIRIARSATISE